MVLDQDYSKWPEAAKQAYQKVKKLAQDTAHRLDLSDQQRAVLNAKIEKAETLNDGTGAMFNSLATHIYNKYV